MIFFHPFLKDIESNPTSPHLGSGCKKTVPGTVRGAAAVCGVEVLGKRHELVLSDDA